MRAFPDFHDRMTGSFASSSPSDSLDPLFAGALLVSLAIHLATLAMLPSWEAQMHRKAEQLTVELQPAPPQPLPPPEPPKPEPPKPEPVKPKPTPPKPLPRPQPVPKPEVRSEPAPPPPPAPVESPPPPPEVIAVAPKSAEPPPTFVAPPPPPEPPPPKPQGPSEQDIDAARNAYGTLLSREFAKHKQYPRIAQMRGWQGIAKVELHLDSDGRITSSSVSESSGHEILDKQALEMVRKASPLPPPPEALRGRAFTIVVPVAFRLE